MPPLSSPHSSLQRNRQTLFIITYFYYLCHNHIHAFDNLFFRTSRGRNLISSPVANIQRKTILFSNSEKDKNKKNNDVIDASVVSRLSLDNHFGRWRLLQNILAGEADPVDANEALGLMLSTYISSEHGISDQRSSENLSLMEDQVCAIESLLEIGAAVCEEEEKYPRSPYIPALGKDCGSVSTVIRDYISKILPDQNEDPDAYQSGWDIIEQLYGIESTKLARKGKEGKAWEIRSDVIRVMLQFDFLGQGISE